MNSFYKDIYSQDNSPGISHGWIQWKGTDVCMDLYCECGHHGHVDGCFFYFYKCPKCHMRFAVGQNVKLIKLSESQALEVSDFKTCDLEE